MTKVKRYDFWQLADRNCAECTTTITTTQQEHYVLASDFDREHQRRVEAEDKVESLRQALDNANEALSLEFDKVDRLTAELAKKE